MTDQDLADLQAKLFFELGFKVDIYHSAGHKGILVVHQGQPLTIGNVVKSYKY